MSVDYHVIIPARYQSSRLANKLMLELAGKTIIQRVYEQVVAAKPSSVLIATDSEIIANHAENFRAPVIMTDSRHPTGTDRLAEVIRKGSYRPEDIIVNVQGDEPFIEPSLIQQVAATLQNAEVPMASLCWPVETKEQLHNPNVVKVVRDQFNNALYFSRSAIPFNRDNPESMEHIFRHIGLYAYRAAFILDYVSFTPAPLETCESLEQLRVLWAGYKIRIEEACVRPRQDINTQADFDAACMMVQD
ncbi:3-deoxy-manno-octulosonate cytidylyltransferase [Legionella birminghamensis]|uniref:3-deoxy-manno-octulosonate cytidylyltransferase n=1 Tax=Legionella birminghamensis TaxID=28083 RepID=A0A378IB81_9GAMM|nr:3-deoxy-manno-octulosonate cytidylyltransferase [Legionella birminghamensis]KTC71734.1 3-deoxy-manno-octulosonate cytidylyltransferase [Legionella birminghamensis]STX32429.1 3-deoxy-manno-octulosonate cytidylyltransferase [Legionella birminghamensis]